MLLVRANVRNAIIQDEELTSIIPTERWISASAVQEIAPPVPFAVLRYGATNPALGSNSGAETKLLRIWIHDAPGSYSNIDIIQARLVQLFKEGQVHGTISIDWQSDGEDQSDPSYGTIFKISTFRIVGTT